MTPSTASQTKTPKAPVVKQASRLPIDSVREQLKKAGEKGITVNAMAVAINKDSPNERDVRLSIDRLRAKGYSIIRSELKTFRFMSEPKPAAAK